MKFAIAMFFLFGTLQVQAEEICLARQNWTVGYGAFVEYQVKCTSRSFETQRRTTSVLFPITIDWGKRSERDLADAMRGIGLTANGEISALNGENNPHDDKEPFMIYEKNPNPYTEYCTVTRYNERTGGIQNPEQRWDGKLACQNSNEDIQITGATLDEINQYLADQGFELILETDFFTRGRAGVMVPSSNNLDLYRSVD